MGGPTPGRRNTSPAPRSLAPRRQRCQGQAAARIQRGWSEPGSRSDAPPRDAGAINYRGSANPGRAQESPGRRCGPRALPPEGRDTPRNLMPRLPDSCGKPRSTPGARATSRLRPRATSATSTIVATVGPTSTKGCAEATTPGVGDATTAGRIGVPRPNHPVRRPSVGPSDGCRSRPGSDPQLLSQSTRGKRDWNYGSQTTAWPANWVERTTTTSSSATSPCSSPTLLAPG